MAEHDVSQFVRYDRNNDTERSALELGTQVEHVNIVGFDKPFTRCLFGMNVGMPTIELSPSLDVWYKSLPPIDGAL